MLNFIKKVFYILFSLICTAALITAIISFCANDYDTDKMTVLGYKFNHVMSGSMSPIINTDDNIISKYVKYEDIQIGDIITYKCTADDSQYKNAIIIHRVIDKTDEYIKTKGDANEVEDPWNVNPDDIISVAIYNINTKTKLLNH